LNGCTSFTNGELTVLPAEAVEVPAVPSSPNSGILSLTLPGTSDVLSGKGSSSIAFVGITPEGSNELANGHLNFEGDIIQASSNFKTLESNKSPSLWTGLLPSLPFEIGRPIHSPKFRSGTLPCKQATD